MLRVLLYVLAVPLVIVLVAALLLPLFLDETRLVGLATDTLEKQTGAQLTVNGEASLSLFPRIALELDEAELSLPGEAQPDLSVRSLAIGVRLMPLLSARVEIDGLMLEGLLVNIPPGPPEPGVDTSSMNDAELDAFYAARRQAREAAGGQAGAEAALALPMALEVESLAIDASRIVLLAREGETPQVIELDSLRASGLNLDGAPVPLHLALRLNTGEGEPVGVSLDATITLDSAEQRLQVAGLNAQVTGVTAEPLDLRADGEFDLQRLAADLELVLRSGPSRGEGQVRYATFESPQIDARLHFDQLSPALLALAGPEATAGTASGPGDGDEAGDGGDAPLPLAALRGIDTRAALEVDRARFDAHEISDLSTQLRIVDGVLRVNRLSGQVHGGKLDMVATFNAAHNTARLATRGSVEGVELPRLLQALEAPERLEGELSLEWKLASQGGTVNQLRDELNGNARLHTRELVLQGLGVERMLCEAVALVNRESLQATLPRNSAFDTLTADLDIGGGKARLAPLDARLPHLGLKGRGEIGLASLDFEAELAARLDQSLAELDPACRVNQRFTAIDWPVACEGALGGEPGDWCRVNTSDIVEDLAKQEVQRKVEKEASRLFNKLLKRDEPETDKPAPQGDE